jgi:hypothetical protein
MMVTKKLLFFAVGLFVITAWIWGSATPALSETLNCKGEGKQVTLKMVFDSPGSFIGISENEVSHTCDNGETISEKSYYSFANGNSMGDLLVQGYSKLTFKDDSTITSRIKLTQLRDPKGEVMWIYDGTGEIIRGTMRFKGVQGSCSIKNGKEFNNKTHSHEFTITYTLPTK